MRIRWKVQDHLILIVVLALGCYGDRTADIDISVGNGEVAINIQGLGDPCEQHTCPDDQRCTVVYHPGFLDVPVAHCLPKEPQQGTQKDDPGGCIDFKLGSNVMTCKTEKEWRDIGHTQCAFRGRVDRSVLTDMQVVHACHSFGQSSEAVFLQAHFTCCQWQPDTTPGNHEHAKLEELVQTELAGDNNLMDDVNSGQRYTIMYSVIVTTAVLVAALIVMIALWQRRKSKRAPRHPKMIFATSFINPSADIEATPTWDNYTGHSDKSLLIVNEQTQFTPGN